MGYIKQSKCCSTQKDDSIEISTNIFINYDQIYIITIMMVIKKNLYIYGKAVVPLNCWKAIRPSNSTMIVLFFRGAKHRTVR